jgi:xanthine dehydrogenase accessory factor
MVVGCDSIAGTIGGGQLEHYAIAVARKLLGSTGPGDTLKIESKPLGADLAQCCGGNVTLLFERLSAQSDTDWLAEALKRIEAGERIRLTVRTDDSSQRSHTIEPGGMPTAIHAARHPPPRAVLVQHGGSIAFAETIEPRGTPLWIYGAGHVGRAVVRVLAETPFHVRWIDERRDPWPGANGTAQTILQPEDAAALACTAPADAFHLVMTHSHELDYRIVFHLMRDHRYAWLGLIGSDTKATCFRVRLAREGISDDAIRRLVSPIGIEALVGAGKEPSVIAIAVAAQLMIEHGRISDGSLAEVQSSSAR